MPQPPTSKLTSLELEKFHFRMRQYKGQFHCPDKLRQVCYVDQAAISIMERTEGLTSLELFNFLRSVLNDVFIANESESIDEIKDRQKAILLDKIASLLD